MVDDKQHSVWTALIWEIAEKKKKLWIKLRRRACPPSQMSMVLCAVPAALWQRLLCSVVPHFHLPLINFLIGYCFVPHDNPQSACLSIPTSGYLIVNIEHVWHLRFETGVVPMFFWADGSLLIHFTQQGKSNKIICRTIKIIGIFLGLWEEEDWAQN